MTAATQLLSQNPLAQNLRALDMQKDLPAVADLIELSFANTLDTDGRRYIRQMRASAKNPLLLGMASNQTYSLAGYVWEENNEIIGNINLIPSQILRQRAYLIANVCVHPDYRKLGIARALTEAALEHIRKRGIKSVWLQVNENNPVAIHLYKTSGFLERSSRSTYHSKTYTDIKTQSPSKVSITSRQSKDWPLQREWLRRTYPGDVAWHLPLNMNLMRPGLSGSFSRIFSERQMKQWSARLGGQLIGTLGWQSSTSMADWLWLGTTPQYQEAAIQSLMPHVLNTLKRNRPLGLNYPAGEAVEAFQEAGFHIHRTLVWMQSHIS